MTFSPALIVDRRCRPDRPAASWKKLSSTMNAVARSRRARTRSNVTVGRAARSRRSVRLTTHSGAGRERGNRDQRSDDARQPWQNRLPHDPLSPSGPYEPEPQPYDGRQTEVNPLPSTGRSDFGRMSSDVRATIHRQTTAVASISTFACGLHQRADLDDGHRREVAGPSRRGRPRRSPSDRARYSSRSVTYQVRRATCSGPAPASASTATMLRSAWRDLRRRARRARTRRSRPSRSARRRTPAARTPRCRWRSPRGSGQPGGCRRLIRPLPQDVALDLARGRARERVDELDRGAGTCTARSAP